MELYEIRQNLNSSKEKLKSLGESLDLEKIFQYSDCSLLSHSDKAIPEESYAEQIKKTNFSAIFTKEQEDAAGKVSQGNATIDKLLKGEALGKEDLDFLNQMQKKYESLQGIWVEELWYNQENISKLKAALEVEEDIEYLYAMITYKIIKYNTYYTSKIKVGEIGNE